MSNYKMKPSDLLFYQEGGVTKSLGFEINNKYLNKMPAIIQKGGKNEKQAQFAVPAGLYLMHKKLDSITGGGHFEDKTIIQDGGHESVNGDLYNSLLELAGPSKKKKATKKGGENKKKKHKTRKKRKAKTRTTRKK